jgi:membrane protein
MLSVAVAQMLQIALSFTLVAVLSCLMFHFVPDKRASWPSCWRGALLTSILFNIGNYFVALYLAQAGTTQAYGLAGSMLVVLLWFYYSAQMFLFGAEFAQISEVRAGLEVARPCPPKAS